MDIQQYAFNLANQAQQAKTSIATAKSKVKNLALASIANAIIANKANILAANQQDLSESSNKLSTALIDRLQITEQGIDHIVASLEKVIQLPDPVGNMSEVVRQDSGVNVGKMRVPLGVIAMIYESRPNVTIEAASLAIKSGNCIILRGGSESINSNIALYKAIQQGLQNAGLDKNIVQLVENLDRQVINHLISLDTHIDIIIPRGGKSLIKAIANNSSIPVIKHLDGICHVYIDKDADINMAHKIAINSKVQRPAVCNAMETLLIHKNIAPIALANLVTEYLHAQVELRICQQCHNLLNKLNHKDVSQCKLANEQDWHTEYLAPILSIKIVENIESAISHINTYGSGHTDSIVTETIKRANSFLAQVNSSSVLLNTSTRFADGFEYGLGAEIGISTDKLHVRGPVGLLGLTSEKYVVTSAGAIKE